MSGAGAKPGVKPWAVAALAVIVAAGYGLYFHFDLSEWRGRRRLVDTIAAAGIRDERVLAAFRAVPRHPYVSEGDRRHAYIDAPLHAFGPGRVSQPYVTAFMLEALELQEGDRALLIEVASGYEAAVLGRLVESVTALAPNSGGTAPALAASANVRVVVGPAGEGWPADAPYDVILVRGAIAAIPDAWLAQLRPGGRLIAPLGDADFGQAITLFRKPAEGPPEETRLIPVFFGPLE